MVMYTLDIGLLQRKLTDAFYDAMAFLSLVCTVMPCYGPFIKNLSYNTLVLIVNYHNGLMKYNWSTGYGLTKYAWV